MNPTLQRTLATIRAAAGDYRGLADQCIHAPKAKATYLVVAADFDAAQKAVESCIAREVALLAEVESLREMLGEVCDYFDDDETNSGWETYEKIKKLLPRS